MKKNKNKNIKAIIFDVGGVIELYESRDVKETIAELVGVPYEKLRQVYFEYNHLTNVGNISWEDMIVKAVSRFDVSPEIEDKIRILARDSRNKAKINTELLALFPVFKKLGLKIGILSNDTTNLRKRLKEKGIINLVDEVAISAEIGFQKPHLEAFQAIFDKLHVKAEETVFVDDSVRSLEKSTEIGYIPILFKNNEQLKADLSNIGLVLP